MLFPSTPREIYSVNPLEQVICQIRYPSILSVTATSPAQFQDAIRSDYPLYEESKNPIIQLPAGVPKEITDLLAKTPLSPIAHPTEYHFLAESRARRISLTQSFVAVTEHQYRQWEDFRKEVILAERVLRETYAPTFYNRVGLRYVDVIIRSKLGLSDTPWSKLFNSTLIGMLNDPNLAGNVQELQVESLLSIPDVEQGRVKLRHGLASAKNDKEQVYLIDADFYTEKRSEPDDVLRALDKFNKLGGNFFRWATSGELRDALGPTRI